MALSKVDISLSEDDVEDLLESLKVYEENLEMYDDGSLYTSDILSNVASLRGRLEAAWREGLD